MTEIPRDEALVRLVEAVETRLSAKINGLTGLTNQVDQLSEDVRGLRREVRQTRIFAILGVGLLIASAFASLCALWATQPNLRAALQAGIAALHH